MEIKIKRIRKGARVPTRGSSMAAGYDLHACPFEGMGDGRLFTIYPHQTTMVGTGLSMAIPEGYFGAIFARSGLASKEGLRPANCVGVIDADYRGEIMVAVHNDSEKIGLISPNERIAQLVILPCQTVKFVEGDLDKTERESGGFGSTGKN